MTEASCSLWAENPTDWMDQETQRRHATTKKKKEDQEAPVVGSEAQRKDLEAHGMTVL